MRIFFDTTVLVAASVGSHPHHAQAWPAFERVVAKRDEGVISTHSIAETFATLTRIPVTPRIHPSEAARIISENLLPHFETVSLEKQDYVEAMHAMRDGGWSGARIYDALILRCAAKLKVDRIYTFNMRHFWSLSPPALHSRICAP